MLIETFYRGNDLCDTRMHKALMEIRAKLPLVQMLDYDAG